MRSKICVGGAIVVLAVLALLYVFTITRSSGEDSVPMAFPEATDVAPRIDLADPTGASAPSTSHRLPTAESSENPAPTVVGPTASAAANYVPSKAERDALRRLGLYAHQANLALPDTSAMGSLQWAQIQDLERQVTSSITPLVSRRCSLVTEVCTQRASANMLEQVPVVEGPGTSRAMRDVARLLEPQTREQLVSHYHKDGRTYICRINPGENALIDDISNTINAETTAAVAAIEQITQSMTRK